VQWHLAELVEEEGATLCLLEDALLGRDGTSERTLFVAEQLTFDEVLRDGGAVDADERCAAQGAEVVNGPGDPVLASPRLPGDEDGELDAAATSTIRSTSASPVPPMSAAPWESLALRNWTRSSTRRWWIARSRANGRILK